MRCPKCGFRGPEEYFSKTNRSADGTKAICKACRRVASVEGRKRKRERLNRLLYFELIPSLLNLKNKAHIGVLIMNNFVDRGSRKKRGFYNINVGNVGLKAILNELDEPYEYTSPETINQFEYVLVSLTSVMDVENLIYNLEVYGPRERQCKIIVGGFGVINIRLIVSYIDIAVFGRAEGQINGVLMGKRYNNVWYKDDDPRLEKQYIIRQPAYLVPGERSVGCRNMCSYCQYTHVRKSINSMPKYDPGMLVQETDWTGLNIIKAGRYNTAWDGWSDETRHKVKKPVTDHTIEGKLYKIGLMDLKGCVNIKIYQIVGYPWETIQSVQHDIENTTEMLKRIDKKIGGRINLSFLCTPFSPEPMTPMQHEKADIETNWRELGGRVLFNGEHIRAYLSPFISGSFSLAKRVMINRADFNDLDLFKQIAFSKELLGLPEALRVGWLLKHGILDLGTFGYNKERKVNLKVEERSSWNQKNLEMEGG